MTAPDATGADGPAERPEPALRLDVVTVFPDYLTPLGLALPGRAVDRGILDVAVHDLRRWAHGVHRAVDDSPFGGGPGMVMLPTVWGDALDELVPAPVAGSEAPTGDERPLLVVPTPAGVPFTQETARRWSRRRRLVFACGRYEGIDQRVVDEAADSGRMDVEEVSIGDYVLVGGEVAVLVMAEAVVRLIPGVLGNRRSHEEDSFSDGLLEGPSYTRPEVWRGRSVPEVLTSGDHKRIDRSRRDESLRRTARRRPELLDDVDLDLADLRVLAEEGWEPRSGRFGID